ncbi:MAG: aminotransferase class V-fold PLP-dependent enzyme [Pseudonocardia sp.]|nr:aminotransferase class V-fold PLP-dependent enzyme [Pseudonocardia sp.]
MSIHSPGSLRSAFAVPADIAYFNTANLSPMLNAVRRAGEDALRRRAKPWTIGSEDWFTDVERLRVLIGELLGGDADGLALVPATSYGFAVAASNLRPRPGSRVLVLAEEYPSGIYTWRRFASQRHVEMVTARREAGEGWTDAVLRLLDERVSVVSVPNVHWTDGAWIDLAAVAARAHEIGAHLVIDASQSLGALPLDVRVLRPDFVVSVGYKWQLGPFGRGYLWAAPEHRDGIPLEENWISRAGSQDFARLVDYRGAYQSGARRYDQGQRTLFELTPMAIAAAEQLLAWGVADIAATLATMTDTIVQRAGPLGLVPSAEERGPHLLGLTLPERVRDDVVAELARARCFAAVRGSVLRISPHLHVTGSDVDRLIDALGAAMAG